ncbi:hypothetical protein JTB14_031020 [Gonioctena quinquepunctata]|nr:hypothetical protein JTB14_031020 [Gonioctena quinquepunctata]
MDPLELDFKLEDTATDGIAAELVDAMKRPIQGWKVHKRSDACSPAWEEGVCNPEIHPHRESNEIPDLATPEFDINSTFETNEPAPTEITGYGDEEVAWRQAMAASAVRTHHKLKDSLKGRAYQDMERRQKGFTSGAGTVNNVALLSQVLRNMKKVCSILNVSKAFDTVLHGALIPSLSRLRIPSYIAQYMSDSYIGCMMKITGRDGVVTIELRRGVKQRDPMSPFLFNGIVDPLSTYPDERERGITVRTRKVAILAFADDLTLVSETVEKAAEDIPKTLDYLKSLGMNLSITKCCSFKIRAMRKTWAIENSCLEIKGEKVQYVGPDQSFKYLGIDFTPWRGENSGGNSLREFVSCCRRVQEVRQVKPQQRLELIKTYIHPKFRYSLVLDSPSETTLREADNEIRQVICRMFHLPDSTTNHLFYSRTRDGGLGYPKLEKEYLVWGSQITGLDGKTQS